ncbi:MAG: response regulator transcription factor [Chloroflexi bacterium]|nr:response regulator transcription factor [Chloroflexota bacterium]
MKTILLVDDSANIRLMVSDYLSEAGYRVVTADNGRDALFTARHEKPDLILLDIMMPEMDGYTFIKTFRKERETPIILLTAKLDETDKVIGLELGADDYVTKPFGMRELVARIRAVLRRAEHTPTMGEVLRGGGIVLDRGSRTVHVGDETISLTPSEFDLLAILMETPERVFSRGELLEKMANDTGVERTIDTHVSNLRSKVPEESIETVFGVGYRFRP